ncbi:MAG: arylsulfatase [Tannerella sp.]|nr:arylsulfatase [Tannerella sp.]
MKHAAKPAFLISGSLLLAAGGTVKAQSKKQTAEKPNVVFIIADDLGYGDLSCYGQEKFRTPEIDRVALHGVRFTQCYSGTTVSAPSRASLLTGLHTGHACIRGNKEVEPEGQFPLPQGTNTFFKLFKEAGYTTGAFGKWGLGSPGSEGDPNRQYVDEFYGYNCQLLAHNYYPDHIWHNDQRIDFPDNDNGAFGTYAQDLIQEKCLAFLDEHHRKPFFLFVPCVLPHAELLVPEDSIIRKFRGMYPEKPHHGTDDGPAFRKGGYCSQVYPRATFAAMVYRFDVYVGQIVRKLKELGVYDNTLIIITSDNGPHQEGGADPDFFNSNGVYRGYKRDLYEGGIRVPMIVSWKGRVAEGTSNDLMCAFWDWMPTFAELTGTRNVQTDGISILPAITGKGKQASRDYLYFEFLELGGRQAVRKGDWKLIRQNIRKDGGTYELYNISSDPSENHNVISEYPQKADELRALMEQSHVEDPNWSLFN